MPIPEQLKTPVTIITGFLGSGKTTLVNHILKNKQGRKVAVVENELGEVNIDNSLVSENLIEKEELVSMNNGCVCCSLRTDIVNALAELDRRAKRRGQKFNNVLLETTGLADPAPVAFTFFANPWIGSKFRLDSILCIVDALYIHKHVADEHRVRQPGAVDEAVNQIAFADTILLNKIDLVSPEQLQKVRDLIRSINVNAELVEVQLNGENADVPLPPWEDIMNVNSFSIERALKVDPTFMDSESDDEGFPGVAFREAGAAGSGGSVGPAEAAATDSSVAMAGAATAETQQQQGKAEGSSRKRPLEADAERAGVSRSAGGGTASGAEEPVRQCTKTPRRKRRKHHDLTDVCSVGITAHGALDQYRFNMFMRDLLSEKARDIFRSKGVLCVKGQEDIKFVFQGVHETICFGPATQKWGEGEAPINQIVFIGRNLSRADLVEGFRSCIWTPLPEGWTEHLDKRTNRLFFINTATGVKTWEPPRAPAYASALVNSTESKHQQPAYMRPRSAAAAAAAVAEGAAGDAANAVAVDPTSNQPVVSLGGV